MFVFLINLKEFLKQNFIKHLTFEWFPSAVSAMQSATQEGAFCVRPAGCDINQKVFMQQHGVCYVGLASLGTIYIKPN